MNIKHVFNVVVPLSRKTECIEHFSDSINRIISMVLLHNLLKKTTVLKLNLFENLWFIIV